MIEGDATALGGAFLRLAEESSLARPLRLRFLEGAENTQSWRRKEHWMH